MMKANGKTKLRKLVLYVSF